MPILPALGIQRQDYEFKASPGYIVRPPQLQKKKKDVRIHASNPNIQQKHPQIQTSLAHKESWRYNRATVRSHKHQNLINQSIN